MLLNRHIQNTLTLCAKSFKQIIQSAKRAVAFIMQTEIEHNKNILMHKGQAPLKEHLT